LTSPSERRSVRKHCIVTETLDWRGVSLSVSYDPSFFVSNLGRDDPQAHLEIHVVGPKGARLPFTEIGYRSHFLPPRLVEQAGGPAAYVLTWLDDAATSRAWRRYEDDSRQLSLF
jgi:hypothetical protein